MVRRYGIEGVFREKKPLRDMNLFFQFPKGGEEKNKQFVKEAKRSDYYIYISHNSIQTKPKPSPKLSARNTRRLYTIKKQKEISSFWEYSNRRLSDT